MSSVKQAEQPLVPCLLRVTCSRNPESGSDPLPGVNETSQLFFETYSQLSLVDDTHFSEENGKATPAQVLHWVEQNLGHGRPLVIHAACHGTTSGEWELLQGNLSLPLLAQRLGRGTGNLIVPDACFGGHTSGRELHSLSLQPGGEYGFAHPPPKLISPVRWEPIGPPNTRPRQDYDPEGAVIFAASQYNQFTWYAAFEQSNGNRIYVGAFTIYLCHSLVHHPQRSLGEHWENVCSYIEAAGNLHLSDSTGEQMDPYLHWSHTKARLPTAQRH